MKRTPSNGLNPTEYLWWRQSNLTFEEYVRRKNSGDPDYRYDGEYRQEDEDKAERIIRHINSGLKSSFDFGE